MTLVAGGVCTQRDGLLQRRASPLQSTVTSGGGGDLHSQTLTTRLAVAVLPALSVAVQTTMCWPIEKVLPDAGVQVTGIGPSLLSVAVRTPQSTTAPAGLVAS